MNAVTFNDSFLPFVEAAKISKSVLQSPLIQWNAERLEVPFSEKSLLRDDSGLLRLPFPAFRVFGAIEFGVKESYKLSVFPHPEKSDAITCLMCPQKQRNDNIIGCTLIHNKNGKTVLGSTECRAFSFLDGKMTIYQEDEPDEFTRNWVKVCVLTMKNDLDLLVADFLNPHLYLCKRCPPMPQGKSILWQKAREHYVLLHKTHAANKREAVGKKTIQDGSLVDRISHSRRAHFRLLRSPKFRHKQGQRIWVQSAWIGPKEWTDRSGQIYRIVERHNESSSPTAGGGSGEAQPK